jgi:hypothetical protein
MRFCFPTGLVYACVQLYTRSSLLCVLGDVLQLKTIEAPYNSAQSCTMTAHYLWLHHDTGPDVPFSAPETIFVTWY